MDKKTPKARGFTYRREQDHELTPMLHPQAVSDEEVAHLYRGESGALVIDDFFYDLLRRIVHLGAIYESDVRAHLRIDARIFEKKKREFPEMMLRFNQYVADRDLIIQAYANNILFDPLHPDHSRMIMHHNKMKYMREVYKTRTEERAVTSKLLEAQRLAQPKIQQIIAVLPANSDNTLAQLSPAQLMQMIQQQQPPPLMVAAKTIEEPIHDQTEE